MKCVKRVAECCSVVMVLVIGCQTLLEDMENMKLLLICILRVLLSQFFYQCIYGFIPVNNVIYVFLLYDCVFSLYVYV